MRVGLTPAGHEYSHGYRGVVVEHASKSGVKTAVAKVDVITETITLGTHDEHVTRRVTDVVPTRVT